MTAHKKKEVSKENRHVTLKKVAECVGLTKGIVSAVLNKSAASRSVPLHTQERIFAAAREMNYRASFYARNLRVRRTYLIGVVAEEIGDSYGSLVISGIERHLRRKNFFS
jgi:DNA-binding LacI/PurR family transcriptional regulator